MIHFGIAGHLATYSLLQLGPRGRACSGRSAAAHATVSPSAANYDIPIK